MPMEHAVEGRRMPKQARARLTVASILEATEILAREGGFMKLETSRIAAKAGIGPGMKLIAVNGRRFSADILREAIRSAKTGSAPIELLVENDDYYKTYKLDYHGGEMYPHLVRDESKPDLLTEILKAK